MKKIILFLILLASKTFLSAQAVHSMSDGSKRIYYTTLADAEEKLLQYYQERKGNNSSDIDNLGYSYLPYKMFKDLVIQDTRAFNYDFPKFIEASSKDDKTRRPIRIVKSADNKIKLYTWDEDGGTMSNYTGITSIANKEVFSYDICHNEFEDSEVTNEYEDLASGAYRIDCFKNNQDETIYLVYNHVSGSTRLQAHTIYAYKLNGNQPIPMNIFKGKNNIGFCFDITNYETDITYKNGEIIVPETRENVLNPYSSDLYTGRDLVYKWDGMNFNYCKISYDANYKLNSMLCNFKYNVIQINMKKYKIRIDKMNDNSYRYASWKRSKDYSNSPDIVINNGYEEINIVDGDPYKKKFKYVFQNKGYFYIVSWFSDYSNISQIQLIVKHNDKIILRESSEI